MRTGTLSFYSSSWLTYWAPRDDLANLDFRPADDAELVNAGKFIEGITVDVSG